MKNLLRLTLILLLSTGLLSCSKDSTPAKDKEKEQQADGSENNIKPDGSKYIDVELASTEPDWNNIKVGETITLKFKVVAPLDESKGQYSRMYLDQETPKGPNMENTNPDVSLGPVGTNATSNLGGIHSIVSQKNTTDPVYMQITIKPNHALKTTITITTTILDEANDTKHVGKIFKYEFTPKN